ncbi:MAG: hypothetical protein GX783_12715 [Clostridiales bacterium]|nr:hypothetical protein [Clostridiales bacterium]
MFRKEIFRHTAEIFKVEIITGIHKYFHLINNIFELGTINIGIEVIKIKASKKEPHERRAKMNTLFKRAKIYTADRTMRVE